MIKRMSQEVFANEIIPRIFLGNVDASKDRDFLIRNNISVIVNCTKDLPNVYQPIFLHDSVEDAPEDVRTWIQKNTIQYHRLAVDDNSRKEEIQYFEVECKKILYPIIQAYKEGKSILVHCLAGSQRSASFLAIWMMIMFQRRFDEVKDFIVDRRPQAFLFGRQVNFQDAISNIESEIFPTDEE
jgi:protein-tyrosine phosphatase